MADQAAMSAAVPPAAAGFPCKKNKIKKVKISARNSGVKKVGVRETGERGAGSVFGRWAVSHGVVGGRYSVALCSGARKFSFMGHQ